MTLELHNLIADGAFKERGDISLYPSPSPSLHVWALALRRDTFSHLPTLLAPHYMDFILSDCLSFCLCLGVFTCLRVC